MVSMSAGLRTKVQDVAPTLTTETTVEVQCHGCEADVEIAVAVAAVAAGAVEANRRDRVVDAAMAHTGRGPGDYPRTCVQR